MQGGTFCCHVLYIGSGEECREQPVLAEMNDAKATNQ